MKSEALQEGAFVREYVKALHDKNAAVFVGAGLSMKAGAVDWKGLLQDAFTDLNLKSHLEHDLVTIAQYYVNDTGGNRDVLTQKIFAAFSAIEDPLENHMLLAALPIQVYWTTNYDKLIENALKKVRKVPDVKHDLDSLDLTVPDRDVTVYKMHGDVGSPKKAIICKDDYERYHNRFGAFVEALSGDLVQRTFLFLGFSFTDPNIDYILSRVRSRREEHAGRLHYCILRKVTKGATETDEEFANKELKQEYFIRDLKRFNILTVLVETFDDITRVLKRVTTRYRRSSVFLSGSAHEYAPVATNDARQFIHSLSYAIASQGNRTITGFGLGVGDAVINGTLEYLEKKKKPITDEDIMMRPFPQFPTGTTGLAEKWTTYRQGIAASAGIAVFLFGNKLDPAGSKVVPANGMDEEFKVCHEARTKLVAVGATGYKADEFHKRILAAWDTYFPGMDPAFRAAYESLGDTSKKLENHIPTVLHLIEELQKN